MGSRTPRSLLTARGCVAAACSAAVALLTLGGGSAAQAALPVVFEANRGQADAEVKFLSRTAGYTVFVTQDGAVLAAPHAGQMVRVRLVGARPEAEVMGLERLPGDGLLRMELEFLEIRLPTTILAGDYNTDGKVDAADYVTWRNDPATFGGAGGYTTWAANFGKTAASGSGAQLAAVPEPAAWLLVAVGMAVVGLTRRHAT